MVTSSKINRMEQPEVKEDAENFAKTDISLGPKIKTAIDNMFGVNYRGKRNMVDFKPWDHFWSALDAIEEYFKQDKWKDLYDEKTAKASIMGGAPESGSTDQE